MPLSLSVVNREHCVIQYHCHYNYSMKRYTQPCFKIFTFQIYFNGSNLVKFYDKIGKDVLPRDYLPDEYSESCMGTCSEIVGMSDIYLTLKLNSQFKRT